MAKQPDKAKGKPAAKKATPSDSKATSPAAPKQTGKPRGLGRGLSSLLGDAGVAAATGTAAPANSGASQAATAGSGQTPQSQLSGLGEIPVEWINVCLLYTSPSPRDA